MRLHHTKTTTTLECTRAELAAFAGIVREESMNICGLHIDAQARVVVSTDGHRMMLHDVGTVSEKELDQSPVDHRANIPHDLVRSAIKTASRSDTISIAWDEMPKREVAGPPSPPNIRITVGCNLLVGHTFESPFVPWRKVIPAAPEKPVGRITVAAKYVAAGCKRIAKAIGIRRSAIVIWMPAEDEHPVVLQATEGMEPTGARWRYILMPLKVGTPFIEPWSAPESEKPKRPTAKKKAAPTKRTKKKLARKRSSK